MNSWAEQLLKEILDVRDLYKFVMENELMSKEFLACVQRFYWRKLAGM